MDIGLTKAPDPEDVKDKQQEEEENGLTPAEARRKAMDVYFRNRTRRVPFAEVPAGAVDPVTIDVVGTGDDMRPLDQLMFPFNPGDGKTGTGFSTLALNTNGTKLYPAATNPDNVRSDREERVGDRVLVGHGLPALWYDNGGFVGEKEKQPISGITWDDSGQRYRQTRSELVKELDATERGGFWEQAAAEHFQKPEDGIGGLRVVTGAGVYLPGMELLEVSNVVWPDTMPQPPVPQTLATSHPNNNNVFYQEYDGGGNPTTSENIQSGTATRPYLQMRASVVYHYLNDNTPIACVSSFYDPTNINTARNKLTYQGQALDDVSGLLGAGYDSTITPPARDAAIANSNNGITYGPAAQAAPGDLDDQASLVYPNGRPVNPLLQEASSKGYANLTPAEQAAVDSTSCALRILDGSITPNNALIPHGTIQEVAFLNPRQIKSIDAGYDPTAFDVATQVSTTTGNYDLPIEDRQPIEVRATVIDLENLRTTNFSGEALIPNSGIIYASRDDALPDKTNASVKVSASDFSLDPTRRPNGIVLINGEHLHRDRNYDAAEKGFILASNLPVYVKGDFNLHDYQEFLAADALNATWGNFYSRDDFDPNFACRPGDPRLPVTACPDGDRWRAATVITDAMTLLSDGFRFGFRNEGDYDLRNNRIDSIIDPDDDATNEVDSAAEVARKRRENGFLTNDFVVNGLSSGDNINFNFPANSIRSGFPSAAITPTDTTYTATATARSKRHKQFLLQQLRYPNPKAGK